MIESNKKKKKRIFTSIMAFKCDEFLKYIRREKPIEGRLAVSAVDILLRGLN